MIDHPRPRIRQCQRVQQRKLRRFRNLSTEGLLAIDHARPQPLEMSEVVERVEDPMAVSAVVGGRTHAIEDQRVLAVAVRLDIEMMTRRIHPLVRRASLVELIEKWTKPVRMLVIDSNWTAEFGHLYVLSFRGPKTILEKFRQKAERPLDLSSGLSEDPMITL